MQDSFIDKFLNTQILKCEQIIFLKSDTVLYLAFPSCRFKNVNLSSVRAIKILPQFFQPLINTYLLTCEWV